MLRFGYKSGVQFDRICLVEESRESGKEEAYSDVFGVYFYIKGFVL